MALDSNASFRWSSGPNQLGATPNSNQCRCYPATLVKHAELIVLCAVPIARAIAYSEPSCCSDGLQTSKAGNDIDEKRTPVGLDYVRRTVQVEVRALVDLLY